jgi:hypothetical protein
MIKILFMGSGIYFGRYYILRIHGLVTYSLSWAYSGIYSYAAALEGHQRVWFQEYDAVLPKKHEITWGEPIGLLAYVPDYLGKNVGVRTLSANDAPPGNHWVHWSILPFWMPNMRLRFNFELRHRR